jgi:hypothetical protein
MELRAIIVLIIIIVIVALIVREVLIEIARGHIIQGSAIMTSRDADVVAREEYARWCRMKAQVAFITRGMNARNAYEARSILERWNLSTFNFARAESDAKMRAEFLEKHLFARDEVDAKIREMRAIKCDAESQSRVANIRESGSAKIITYGDFARTLSNDRFAQLSRVYSGNRADFDSRITAMLMRYASLVPGGQQWCLPARAYDLLASKYGADLEGFASPINSQMLRIDRGAYCSLFADTDTYFGSRGSFFDVDLTGHVAIINPPYVIDIMDEVVNKCSACLESADCVRTRMFIIVPGWTDAEFYDRLAKSPHLERMLIHPKFAHFYEDINTGASIVATFAQTIFVLASRDIKLRDATYADLTDAVSARHVVANPTISRY